MGGGIHLLGEQYLLIKRYTDRAVLVPAVQHDYQYRRSQRRLRPQSKVKNIHSRLNCVTGTNTPCPRKNCTPVYVAITLANNVHFNEILRQHWDVKLQTSHQISVKSVNICNSYSKFSKVTQKHKCPLQAQAWLTVKCASVRMARRQHT